MKIGFYGNANNYPFMLARAIRRAGHEILFLVGSRERLNRPENRYADIPLPYPAWIHDVSHVLRWHCLVPGLGRRHVQALLNTCDFAFLNEEGPALSKGLHIPYAAVSTGSDLQVFANPARVSALVPQVISRPRCLAALARHFIPLCILRRQLLEPQRAGFLGARFITHFARGLAPEGDRLLDDMGVSDSKRVFFLMADLEINPYTSPAQNPLIRVFCLARLTWKIEQGSDLVALDYKGTDIMIRGLALFYQKHRIRLDIRLVRKGRHVAEAEELVANLGLSDQVTWLSELTQSQARVEYCASDIIFDQLADSVVGMGGLEAMATGRPLIANARPEIMNVATGEPSPICQASSTREVCGQLERLVFSPDERLRVGLASRRYVEKHFSADAAARLCLEKLGIHLGCS